MEIMGYLVTPVIIFLVVVALMIYGVKRAEKYHEDVHAEIFKITGKNLVDDDRINKHRWKNTPAKEAAIDILLEIKNEI